MSRFFSKLTNVIGSTVLPFSNPRVVCPPGQPGHYGRRNIIVATPMRSGTHLLIDMILNNIPAYRTRPLYIDFDQCLNPRHLTAPDPVFNRISPQSGHVLKTHLPVGVDPEITADPAVTTLIDAALIITVRRDKTEIERSLKQWNAASTEGRSPRHRDEDYDRFWQFWQGKETIELRFADLFDPQAMTTTIGRIAEATGTQPAALFRGPAPAHRKLAILRNKALTRIAGRFAPRIDTTIHTLKS